MCHSLPLFIILGKKIRHTMISLIKWKRSLIVSKNILEQGKYMSYNPKRELGTWGSKPR